MSDQHKQSPKEKCLILLKPDCVERKLTGRFLELVETTGLKIIALKMISPSETLISEHYAADHTWLVNAGRKRWQRSHPDQELPEKEAVAIGQDIRRFLIEGLSHHRIIAAVIEGPNAIQYLRKLVGSTEPLSAEPGTLRGLYSTDSYEIANIEHRSIQNLIHVSDSETTADREIKIWFRQDEIYE